MRSRCSLQITLITSLYVFLYHITCMFPFTQGLNSLIKWIWLMLEIWCRTPVQHKESGNWCILYGTLLPADSRKSPVLGIQVEDDYTTSHLQYEYSPVSFTDILEGKSRCAEIDSVSSPIFSASTDTALATHLILPYVMTYI